MSPPFINHGFLNPGLTLPTYGGWTKSCTTLKPWEVMFCRYLPGGEIIIIPVCERWCEMELSPSTAPRLLDGSPLHGKWKPGLCNLLSSALIGRNRVLARQWMASWVSTGPCETTNTWPNTLGQTKTTGLSACLKWEHKKLVVSMLASPKVAQQRLPFGHVSKARAD